MAQAETRRLDPFSQQIVTTYLSIPDDVSGLPEAFREECQSYRQL